jgi:hypothetical protein
MDSVAPDWFWFWLPLLVVVVVRALAAPSLGLCALSSLGHHNVLPKSYLSVSYIFASSIIMNVILSLLMLSGTLFLPISF